MAVWIKACGADTSRIFGANAGELTELLNQALNDMVNDTFSNQKDFKKPRKVKLDLKLTRAGTVNNYDDDICVEWRVTPVPAPYEKLAEDWVPDGQQSLQFDENGEISE